ncbi:HTH-type transcriptional regulator YidZ [Photobacterium swingsii]|uniref:DNA-binding transcriptional regulator n=1 Tax=Photobacterium sanguinicancri TaxID=875932 RepID=A0ABX4FWL1_9GAMM|nr:HTH-type transcriptional regulator YidZ [Photobacterium sanguinicancri]MDO6496994.1 HTH-type transcriptional regulator YidZ [Photobacterium sanguinicancri]OZS43268.1 DNA-binding transcriptional regulator [Photobacterium sanguinicancri]
MKKSLARLDLNLLSTLQLLLQEQSVSKTAKKLNVTPSTVSKSLTKLRDWFDDPLFVKTPQGLRPTTLAQSMSQDLSDWLQIGSQLLAMRNDNKPEGVQFNLTIESPLLLLMFNALSQEIYRTYPAAKIKVKNWDYDSLESIIQGETDIGFTGRESHPRSKESLDLLPYFIDFEVLFHDSPVVFLHKDHPALQQDWDLEAFLQYPHINIVWEKSESWALDEVLAENGLTRNVALTMASFEQSLFMAAQSGHDMITTAPQYCQQYTQQLHPDLVCLPIPLEAEAHAKLSIPFTMIWHKRNGHNPKIQWLKETIKQLYCQ